MAITAAEKARSGTKEWVFQRTSNFMICVWGAVFIAQIFALDGSDFSAWQSIFQPLWFKIFSTIVLSFIAVNSVLAGWQIGTDYVKVASLNKIYILVCFVGSAVYFSTGIYILWLQ